MNIFFKDYIELYSMTNNLDGDFFPTADIKFLCSFCNYGTTRKSCWNQHIKTKKHIKNMKNDNNNEKYECKKCNFFTFKKNHYLEHLKTKKHISIFGEKKQNTNENTLDNRYECICGKCYKTESGYYKHIKKCFVYEKHSIPTENNVNNEKTIKLMKLLSSSNKEVIKEVLSELKPCFNTTIYNTHNNHLNINMFLDNQCKNAINFSDFIQSLPITPKLYDETRENGLTKSLTNLMIEGLNSMNILERPIHCTDLSRKVLYVRENDIWHKDKDHEIVKGGIVALAVKQRSSISIWQEANPGWNINDNKQIVFSNLIQNALELCEHQEKDQNKILKALSLSTYITKENTSVED